MTWLTVPGLGSSGAEHWQTLWERARADCRRVELGDWDDPDRERWVAALDVAIRQAGPATVLVAHSLGCLTVAWWASRAGREVANVTAAMLVAPPDVERLGADPRIRRFEPSPTGALPFPALLLASRDDPYASIEASAALATGWSAQFHDAGAAGHLNAASGLGSWTDGQRLFDEFLAQADERRLSAHNASSVAQGAPPLHGSEPSGKG